MNLYVKNHGFRFELENLTRLFFPNEKINIIKEFSLLEQPYIYTELSTDIKIQVNIGEFFQALSVPDSPQITDKELEFAKLLYKILNKFTGVSQPWGLLTGVRPVKLFRKLIEEGSFEYAKNKFKNDFFVSEEKLLIAEETEKNEKRILNLSKPDSFSLYVGIPFCPSRCSYCSFVMASIERAKALMAPYVDLLCEEIKHTAEIANRLNLKLETIYFGGGTPTTLTAQQLGQGY